MEARGKWHSMFQVLKKSTSKPESYPAKIYFMSEEEMKTFSNERKLSCSTVTRSSSQQGYFKKNGYKKLYKQEGSDFF